MAWRTLSRRSHASAWRMSPTHTYSGLRHAVGPLRRTEGGNDVPKLEPVQVFSYHRIDKIVRELKRIYKDNPAYFEIPEFAQKVY